MEKKAKENLEKAGEQFGVGKDKPSANLPNPIDKVDTRAELAKLAGVGERTYGKAATILPHMPFSNAVYTFTQQKTINLRFSFQVHPFIETG